MKTILGFMLFLGTLSLSSGESASVDFSETTQSARIDTFTFSSNGTETKGKIYLPASYETNKNLPAVFLIDFTEQHFTIARDEFEKVIEGVEQIEGFEALVVSLENIPDIDALRGDFWEYYNIYRDMASYVDGRYTNNTTRTFIGRGSESGIVLLALFKDSSETPVFKNFIVTDTDDSQKFETIALINSGNFPQENKQNIKLHFSFSSSNNRTVCINLINTINEAEFPWLQFESIEYANRTYPNTYPVSYAAGLEYIFSDTQTGLVENLSTAPGEYQLEQNYPNPFNPSTTIAYHLPDPGNVVLKIYDGLGHEVRTLISTRQQAGTHSVLWDGSNNLGIKVSSGIFIYQLQAGDFTETRKLILQK